LTDPNNLQPDVPKAFREAAELVRVQGGFLGKEEQTLLLRKLRSVPSSKVITAVREALRSEESDKSRIQYVAEIIEGAGIQPPPKVEPLPEVTEEQVRLVTWMAVKGVATE